MTKSEIRDYVEKMRLSYSASLLADHILSADLSGLDNYWYDYALYLIRYCMTRETPSAFRIIRGIRTINKLKARLEKWQYDMLICVALGRWKTCIKIIDTISL